MKFNILSKITLTSVLVMIIPIIFAGVYLNKLIEQNNNERINESLIYGKNYILNTLKVSKTTNKAKSIKIAGDRRLWNYLSNLSDKDQNLQDSQQFQKDELLQMMAANDVSILKIYDTKFNELFDGSYQYIDEKFRQTDSGVIQQGFSGITTKEVLMHQGILIYSASPVREYYKGTVATGKITNILVQGKLIKRTTFEKLKELSGQEICLIETGQNGELINVITTLHDAYGTNLSGQEIVGSDFAESIDGVISNPEESIFRTISIGDKSYRSIIFPIKTSDSKLYVGAVFQEADTLSKGVEQYYIGILIIIVLSSILFASVLISRSILKPLNMLVHGIDELSGNINNDEKIAAIDVNTRDEFYTLSKTFNNMAEKLQCSFSEVELLKDYLKNIFDSISSILIAIDEKGVITHWNSDAEKFFSIQSEKAVGCSIWGVTDIFSEMRQTIEGVIHSGVEDEYDRKYLDNGAQRFQHVSLFPLISNKIVGLVVRVDDTTEFEKKSLQLQQAQKMEAIGTLAGGIAHDFNNMLGVILGYSEMARDQAAEESQLYANLDQVMIAGQRAQKLVEHILTFSRQSESEQINLQLQPLINEITKLLRSSIPATVTIKQNIDEKCGAIKADPVQLHQIIMNLCTNGYHAMEERGGTLTIGLKKTELTADDLRDEPFLLPGSYLCLTVRDTGLGIDPDVLKRIFDPFFTTKEVGKGTGMGLAMVHGIVENHGGMILCESEINRGTTFKVFFPEITEAAEEIIDIGDTVPMGSERILFVDDEQLLVDMGTQLLEYLGYSVTALTSSLEALEMFRAQPDYFDLVITDQTMPQMTGADLAREIFSIRPRMPVILCTGYSSIMSKEKAIDIGLSEFVMKPLTQKDIAPLIREILDGPKVE
ncbi:MAG: ATP-binding protein [Thermodesulfobacteriota bacterium]